MAISVVGSNSAAATTVTIPTHQVGDLIVISARRANNSEATLPSGNGTTIPDWATNKVIGGGANTLALSTSAIVATRTDHASGTWTNASHLMVTVWRGTRALSIGASANANGNNRQQIIYPALTLQAADGTSAVYRVGTRGVANANNGNEPPDYTRTRAEPGTSGSPSASTLLTAHRRLEVAANPSADTVSTASSNSPDRAHSVEIKEELPPQDRVISGGSTASAQVGAATATLALTAVGASAASAQVGSGIIELAEDIPDEREISGASAASAQTGIGAMSALLAVVGASTASPQIGDGTTAAAAAVAGESTVSAQLGAGVAVTPVVLGGGSAVSPQVGNGQVQIVSAAAGASTASAQVGAGALSFAEVPDEGRLVSGGSAASAQVGDGSMASRLLVGGSSCASSQIGAGSSPGNAFQCALVVARVVQGAVSIRMSIRHGVASVMCILDRDQRN